jgi:hypothetical protein
MCAVRQIDHQPDRKTMPYATPLREVPSVPQPDGPYVKDDHHPTQQLFDCLKAMQQCLESFKAALQELEP